jgi:preprotein translocase subunit Sec63
MAAITAERVREAAEVLGIQDRASLNEIRIRYYERIKEWHPDVSRRDPAVSHEMTIRLKKAYDLLVDYCMNYTFSFRIGDLSKDLGQTPADYWMERFGDDPIWR